MDPISARVGRDIRPQFSRLRVGSRESFSQICRYRRFRVLCGRRDLEGDNVARLCARSLTQLPVHFEPVAFLAVGLEHGLKGEAIDGAFDRRHATRGKLRTGVLWQDEKGPGVGLTALRRPEEFRFEADLRNGFGHLPGITDIIREAQATFRGHDKARSRQHGNFNNSRLTLLSVRGRFFDQSCDFLPSGDVNSVTGARDFDLMALGSLGIPPLQVRTDGSISSRY